MAQPELTDRTHDWAKAADSFRDDLLSGRTLALHAASARSAYGYRPPLNRSQWSHAMKTLATMAEQSDAMAQIAAAIMGRVNLYGDKDQACASIYGAAFEAVKSGFDDVIGRAGPEPGRYSDHQRQFTMLERIALMYWLELACRPMSATAPGVGWCLSDLAEQYGYRPHRDMEIVR